MVLNKKLATLFILGTPLLLLIISIFLAVNLASIKEQFIVSNALVLDFVLTIPLVYFLLIRKTTISKFTVIPLFALGLLLASIFIPSQNQQYLQLIITYVFPVVELGVFLFVVNKIYNLIKAFKNNKESLPDFYDNLKHSASSILPNKLSSLFATEISVLYYGFVYWRKKTLKKYEFSSHKNSGSVGLFFGLLLIIGVEMSVVHVVLVKWNDIVAWVLTGLSIYSSVQIFGFLKSVIKRPIVIKNEKLHLRYGVLSETIIPIHSIESIEYLTKTIDKESDIQYLSPLKELDSHNIIIQLVEENSINSLYGMKKKYTSIAFFVDNPLEFITQIDKNRKAL